MFGLFQSKKEKLLKKYNKLLKESYELSNVSRKDSDAKLAEANEILQQIEKIDWLMEFSPNLTPKEIIRLGSFGGTYFDTCGGKIDINYKEFPIDWFENLP